MRLAKYAQDQLQKAAEFIVAGNRRAARDAAERAIDALAVDDAGDDEPIDDEADELLDGDDDDEPADDEEDEFDDEDY